MKNEEWILLAVSLISLNLSIECSESFLRFFRFFPSDWLAFSFDFTEKPSPQRFYNEPSPSQRRAFAKSMTNLRQLVESKGAVQSIPKSPLQLPQEGGKPSGQPPSNSPEGEGSHPDEGTIFGPPPTPPRGREAIRMESLHSSFLILHSSFTYFK